MKNIIFLNKNIFSIILKKKSLKFIFFYNLFFFLFIYVNDLKININLNYLEINNNNKINIILKKIFYFNLKKFNFNGKGFKLKKIKNINIFNFNNSHIKILKEKNLYLIKNNKNSFLLLQKFNSNNILYLNFLKNLFKINIFTKKGIKINNSLIRIKKIKKK